MELSLTRRSMVFCLPLQKGFLGQICPYLFSLCPLSSYIVHVEDDVLVLELDLGDGRRLDPRVKNVLQESKILSQLPWLTQVRLFFMPCYPRWPMQCSTEVVFLVMCDPSVNEL